MEEEKKDITNNSEITNDTVNVEKSDTQNGVVETSNQTNEPSVNSEQNQTSPQSTTNVAEVIVPELPEEKPTTGSPIIEHDPMIENYAKNMKKKRIIKKVKKFLFFVFLLLAGAYGFMHFKALKPNELIDSYVTEGKGYIEKYFVSNKNEINFLEDDVKQEMEVTFNTTDQDLAAFNNIILKIDASETTKNEFAKLNFNLKQGEASQDFNAFLKEKDMVFELVNINNGLFGTKLEINLFDNIKEYAKEKLTKEDIKYIAEKYIEYFGESLKEANISTKETLSEVSYSITIDKEAKERINKKFNELVKSDEKVSKLYKEDYKLFATSEYISDEVDDTITFNLTLNRFNKKINKFDFKEYETTINGIRTADDKFEITSKEKGKIVITEKTDSRDFVIYDKDNKETGNGSLTLTTNGINVKYNSTLEENKSSYAVDYKKISDTKSNINFSYLEGKHQLDLDLSLESMENKMVNTGDIKVKTADSNLTIKMNQTITFGKDLVSAEELKPAKDINTYTAEEVNQLRTDLMNKLGNFEFMKEFNNLQQNETY